MKRRDLFALLPLPALAQSDEALQRFSGGRPLREGRVQLEVAPLVENGNAVPVTLRCEGAVRLALVAPQNPVVELASFRIGPFARPEVSTRIRMATSQTLVTLAETVDGQCWQQPVRVLVTLAACIEGESP